jgi:hypothetical protein
VFLLTITLQPEPRRAIPGHFDAPGDSTARSSSRTDSHHPNISLNAPLLPLALLYP